MKILLSYLTIFKNNRYSLEKVLFDKFPRVKRIDKYMIDNIDNNNDISVYENDIDKYIHLFFDGESEDDIKQESMARWQASLIYTFNHLFKHKKEHKTDNKKTNININDKELVSNLLDYYYYISLLYNKEISMFSFCLLCGFNKWDFVNIYGNGASCNNSTLLQNIRDYRHESLKSLLLQGGKSQFGATVILNHDYDYNLPGSNRDVVERRKLNKSDIAEQLGISLDSSGMIEEKDNI